MDIEEAIRKTSLGTDLSDWEVELIASSGVSVRHYSKKDFIQPEEKILNIYYVVEGDLVEVLPTDNKYEPTAIQDHIVGSQVFGDLISDDDLGNHRWKSRKDSIVLKIPQYCFEYIHKRGGNASVNLGYSVLGAVQRIHYLEIARLQSYSSMDKIILFLNFEIEQARKSSKVPSHKFYECERMTWTDMSRFSGVARETFSRVLLGKELSTNTTNENLIEKVKKLCDNGGLAYQKKGNTFISCEIPNLVREMGFSKVYFDNNPY